MITAFEQKTQVLRDKLQGCKQSSVLRNSGLIFTLSSVEFVFDRNSNACSNNIDFLEIGWKIAKLSHRTPGTAIPNVTWAKSFRF